MVRPSALREMVKQAVEQHGISVPVACQTIMISETCYRYKPKLSDENAQIADWLVRLTHTSENGALAGAFILCATLQGLAATTSGYTAFIGSLSRICASNRGGGQL